MSSRINLDFTYFVDALEIDGIKIPSKFYAIKSDTSIHDKTKKKPLNGIKIDLHKCTKSLGSNSIISLYQQNSFTAEMNTYSLRIKTNRKGTIKGMKHKKVNLNDDSWRSVGNFGK